MGLLYPFCIGFMQERGFSPPRPSRPEGRSYRGISSTGHSLGNAEYLLGNGIMLFLIVIIGFTQERGLKAATTLAFSSTYGTFRNTQSLLRSGITLKRYMHDEVN